MAVDIIARGMAGGANDQLDKLSDRVDNIEQKEGLTVDSEINGTSQNPVENRAVYDYTENIITTNSENYIGKFNSVAELEAYSGTVTNNDYAIVQSIDSLGNVTYSRYRYDGGTNAWVYQYAINNTSYTANQLSTINSGMTVADKTKLDGIEAGADRTIVDNVLSEASENPVQNKAVVVGLDKEYNKADDIAVSQEQYNALDNGKFFDDKNYYVYNAQPNSFRRPIVYGWHVDPDESDPFESITYLQDAVGMKPAAMGATEFDYGSWKDAFFMPKPCMLYSNGTVAYYLDPDDYTKKIDGTPSDVANADFDGNAMMEWPLIWYKFEQGSVDGEGYFYCSSEQIDESYNCWCNYDSNDNITPYFYTAIYNGVGSPKMRSLSGIAVTAENSGIKVTGTNEYWNAFNNNIDTSNPIWCAEVFADRILIYALLILMGKSTDFGRTFGKGTSNVVYENPYICGKVNDKGLFWGNTEERSEWPVKVFGMENYWWSRRRRVFGCSANGNSIYTVKITYGNADGTTTRGYASPSNGYNTLWEVPKSGYVQKMNFFPQGFLPVSISPHQNGGLYDDSQNYDPSSFYGNKLLQVGYSGAFEFFIANTIGYYGEDVGSALSCKPLKK